MEAIHAGHRKRLKDRCEKFGFDSLEEHEKLELLLFNVIPRRDTNPIAHNLLRRFGSLAGVFEASSEELKTIDGVGETAAYFLRLMPSVAGSYISSKWEKGTSLGTTEQLHSFARDIFIGKTEEEFAVITLDSNRNLKNYAFLEKGTVNNVSVYPLKITEYVVKTKAVHIVLAHNHPNGMVAPSLDDIKMTRHLDSILSDLTINVIDHIIVAGERCYSMRDMNNF